MSQKLLPKIEMAIGATMLLLKELEGIKAEIEKNRKPNKREKQMDTDVLKALAESYNKMFKKK